MTNAMHRLVAGDPWRKTRMHDMRGRFVGVSALATDLPRVLIQAAVREGLGIYPVVPWIPYPAIRTLAKLVRPDWRVLEYGAGMSTLWWAERVGSIHSIEPKREWYDRIQADVRRRGLKNVTLDHRPDYASYCDLSAFPDRSFDMMVIDGHVRDRIVPHAFRLVTRPGWIYLDNTDFAAQWQENFGDAEDHLVQCAQEANARVEYFTGFPPATLVANEGMLINVG